MTTRILVAVLMLAFTVVAQTSSSSPAADKAAAPSKPEQPLNPALFRLVGNYGGWWNNISEAEKDAYIDGYTTAASRATSLTLALCQSKTKEAQPGAACFNEKFYGGMDLCFVGGELSFKLDKPLKPKLDEFYKEPLNVRIPIEFSIVYVRDEIAGKKTAGQLLDELNEWRKELNK